MTQGWQNRSSGCGFAPKQMEQLNHGLFYTLFLVQLAGYALLIPFFGLGIYLLRRRYLYFEESTTTLELATGVFVGVFFWIETLLLRQALAGQFLLYFSAVLGLSMAAFALYAHVAISLASRLLVDMVVPANEVAVNQPRFGSVEALERVGDYEATLGELLVLARIYSRNVEVLSRVGRVQMILGHPDEAAAWYLRARKRAKSAKEALEVVNHLCTLYDNELGLPEKSDYQLARFMQDFPDSPDLDIVRDRLSRRADKTDWSVSDFLGALEEEPLSVQEQPSTPDELPSVGSPLKNNPAIELVALETAGASEETPTEQEAPKARQEPEDKKESACVTLVPLSESQFESSSLAQSTEKNNGTKPKTYKRSRLEAMEQTDTPPAVADVPSPAPKKSSGADISLEPMDDNPA